jgi:hypothetical protein
MSLFHSNSSPPVHFLLRIFLFHKQLKKSFPYSNIFHLF